MIIAFEKSLSPLFPGRVSQEALLGFFIIKMTRFIPIDQIDGYDGVFIMSSYCRLERKDSDAISDNLARSGLEILATDDPLTLNVTRVEEQKRLQIRAQRGKILGLRNPKNSPIISEMTPDSIVLKVPARNFDFPIEIFYNR